MRKFTISYSKVKAENSREKRAYLENKLKVLEQNLTSEQFKREYVCQQELNTIYDEIGTGIKIRSRCNWYEFGEKSNKFFLNLEKHRASQNTIKSLIKDKKQIYGIHNINSHILSFYKDLFHDKTQCNIETCRSFLKDIDTPYLTCEQRKLCEGELTENEIFDALTGIDNNKSPGNDGLTKEFYRTFWNDIKNDYMSSLKESKRK